MTDKAQTGSNVIDAADRFAARRPERGSEAVARAIKISAAVDRLLGA